MRKGDLVQVRLGGTANERLHWCEVLDYRADVYGGSSASSWRDRHGVSHPEFTITPRRGEVLLLFYGDGDISWIDEAQVESMQPHG